MKVNKHEAAAIIGMYRMGAKWEEISGATRYDIATIKIVIAKYFKAIAIAL